MDLRRSLVEKKLAGRSKNPSKNTSRANSNHGTDDEYDTDDASVASLESTESFTEANLEQNWEGSFDDCIEAILDRKGSSVQAREDALLHLLKFMTLRVTRREIGSRDVALALAISKMLKNARSEKEALLCSKVLAVLYITCPDNDGIYAVISSSLRTAVNLPYPAAKAAALTALGTAALVLCSAPEAQDFAELLIEIVENDGQSINAADDGLVVSSAEDALATAISVLNDVDSLEFIQLASPCLIEQLESVDPKVRAAAGEGLALFFEMTAIDPDDTDAVEAYKNNPPVADVHHLTQLLAQLATTSSKKQSKLSRREQHHTFREVLATVSSPTSHSAPSETIRFGKASQVLYITTWLQVTRLNHMRRVLGTGLQIHLKKNAVVRRLLQYDGPPPPQTDDESDTEDDLSKDLKHSINQELRKQRHKDRNSERKEKSAMSSSFLAEDDV